MKKPGVLFFKLWYINNIRDGEIQMDYMNLDLPSIRGLLTVWESHWSMLKDLGLSTSEADIKLEILKFILVQKVREEEDMYDDHTTDADIRFFEMNP